MDGKTEIDINEWGKLDLRVAKVLAAECVEGTDRLLQLEIDVGGETRTIVAGIAIQYRTRPSTGLSSSNDTCLVAAVSLPETSPSVEVTSGGAMILTTSSSLPMQVEPKKMFFTRDHHLH